MRLTLPAKYKRTGLHVWCNTCKKVVTKSPCRRVGHNMVYQSRVWNPNTKQADLVKSWSNSDVEEAYLQHQEWKRLLVENEYDISAIQVNDDETGDSPQNLDQGISWYLDYLKDLNVEEFEKKNLSKDYILEQKRYINRFREALIQKGVKIKSFQLDKRHLGIFHNYLEAKGYANKTYNKHIVGLRTMYNAFIAEGFTASNPFNRITQKYTVNNPDIIYEEELGQLFKVISYDNGWAQVGKTRRNHYRPWLKNAILLALYTGERRDGVFLLKWRHVEENYIKIPNFKVNRKQKIEDHHYLPITQDVASFLLTLERGEDDDYIIEPAHENRQTLKDQCSKAFSHFWSIAGFDTRKEFKALRKTLETRLWDMLGDKSKALKRHKNLSTTIDFYLGQKQIMEELQGQKLFGFLSELNTTT